MAITEEFVVIDGIETRVLSGTLTRYVIRWHIHASSPTDYINVVIGTTASHLIAVVTFDGSNAMTNDYNVRIEDPVGNDIMAGLLTDDTTAKVTKATTERFTLPGTDSTGYPPAIYAVAGAAGPPPVGLQLKVSSFTGALQTADDSGVFIMDVTV